MYNKYKKYILLLMVILASFINVFSLSKCSKNVKISVIIPVYNVEKYLNECLESVTNQSHRNLEIICVNDGSTDNSPSILRSWQNRDSRIKIIDQNNKGVASARNSGTDIATGEYTAYVDPDDILDLNAYKTALNKIQDNVDILVWGYNAFPNASRWWNMAGTSKNKIYNNNSVNAYFDGKSVSVIVWNKLYRTSLLKDNCIRFNENLKIAEDVGLNMIAFAMAKKIQFIDDRLYNYRLKREGSLTETYGNNMKAFNHKILFEDVLNNWKRLGVLKGNEYKVLGYFTRMAYNTIRDIKDQGFKKSYSREILNLFWNFMNKNNKNKLTSDTKNKLSYIQKLAFS